MGIQYLANLGFFVPELVVIATMMALLFLEATYSDKEQGRDYVFYSGVIGLVVAGVCLILNLEQKPTMLFTNSIVIDQFGTLLKLVLVFGTLGAVYLGRESLDIYQNLKSEFIIMSMGVLVGGMLLISANNMLTVYLGVETLSVLSYVMASFKKNSERSSEAGLKYVLYGGISAGVMIYGISHIYGVVGSIQFVDIVPQLAQLTTEQTAVLLPAFLLFFVGLGYKIACVPFHMWSPDVYEGSPLPVTTFFAIVPKMAGIAAVLRVTMLFFSDGGALQVSWLGILSVVAALTMTVGNVSAINQRSVKRMLAYSSISHAGFMLLGVIVMNDIGTRAILFYAITYMFMTLVAFYVTSFISDRYGNDEFERFNGLIKRYPFMAIVMVITMFSLAGLPPFSGFIAKFNILAAIIDGKQYSLAVIAVLNSVVSLYYYLRLARLMVLKDQESDDKIQGFGFTNQVIIIGLTVPVVLLGIFWNGIMSVASGAKIFLQ